MADTPLAAMNPLIDKLPVPTSSGVAPVTTASGNFTMLGSDSGEANVKSQQVAQQSLDTENQTVQSAEADLVAATNELHTQQDILAQKTSERDGLKTQLTQLQGQISTLSGQLSSLQSQLSAANAAASAAEASAQQAAAQAQQVQQTPQAAQTATSQYTPAPNSQAAEIDAAQKLDAWKESTRRSPEYQQLYDYFINDYMPRAWKAEEEALRTINAYQMVHGNLNGLDVQAVRSRIGSKYNASIDGGGYSDPKAARYMQLSDQVQDAPYNPASQDRGKNDYAQWLSANGGSYQNWTPADYKKYGYL